MGKWQPLNRAQALATREVSRAGEIFLDHQGQLNEILYTILTPVGYEVCVSIQKLDHMEKHSIASRHKSDVPYIVNNPDLVTPNFEEWDTHIFYKAIFGKLLLAVPVHMKDDLRFVATMYKTDYIKGLKQNLISTKDFLYLRGGFKWKKWK